MVEVNGLSKDELIANLWLTDEMINEIEIVKREIDKKKASLDSTIAATEQEHLKAVETCWVMGIGNSMTPILKSKQPVIVEPVAEETELEKRDIVLAKVKGHYYLHLIHGIKGNGQEFLIGNNHGHMNGWVSRNNVFGKVVEIL